MSEGSLQKDVFGLLNRLRGEDELNSLLARSRRPRIRRSSDEPDERITERKGGSEMDASAFLVTGGTGSLGTL